MRVVGKERRGRNGMRLKKSCGRREGAKQRVRNGKMSVNMAPCILTPPLGSGMEYYVSFPERLLYLNELYAFCATYLIALNRVNPSNNILMMKI